MPILSKSWRTNTAGIASIVVGVGNLTIDTVQHGKVSMEAVGICLTAIFAGIGLMNAKDVNVSNSPTPLATAQKVGDTLAAVAQVANIPPVDVVVKAATMVEQEVASLSTTPPIRSKYDET